VESLFVDEVVGRVKVWWSSSWRWVLDTAERAVKTFVQVFLLQLVAAGWFSVDQIVDLSLVQRSLLAGGAAALSVVSSAISKKFGSSEDASLMVGAPRAVPSHSFEDNV
jgi:hypothetical protein